MPTPPVEARTPTGYAAEVDAQMRHLATMSVAMRVPIAWVATNPFPINAGGLAYLHKRAKPYDMSACPPGERRFPHILNAYNTMARRLARSHGLEFLDTWEIALPLFDLSSDGAHYIWPVSPVARPQAARAVQWVQGAQTSLASHRTVPCI